MEFWAIKDALLANKIEDRLFYEIDELDGIPVQGKYLKRRDFLLQVVERYIQWCAERPGEFARYYPKWYRWLVWQFDPDAPAYEINCKFQGVGDLVKELQLPYGENIFYRSRIFTDTSFRVTFGLPPDTPKQYTIEVLGVKTKPLSQRFAEIMGTLLPISLHSYSNPPMYFQEPDSYLTVIWRLRVFSSPVEFFKFSPSTPLAPLHPGILHFEHRWHPQKGIEEMFKNIEQVLWNDPSLLDRFKSDIFSLLFGQQKLRRPKNSGKFTTAESFLKIYNEALNQCGGKEPPLKELLRRFNVSPNTYYKYAKRYGVYKNRRSKPSESIE
jgi:hypothetical protein